MKEKTQSVKKPAAKKASKAPGKAASGKTASGKAAPGKKDPAKTGQGGWAETMKKALENKRPASGFPDQPKPRDSGVQKVKKNAF
jgi:hypothetical protein